MFSRGDYLHSLAHQGRKESDDGGAEADVARAKLSVAQEHMCMYVYIDRYTHTHTLSLYINTHARTTHTHTHITCCAEIDPGPCVRPIGRARGSGKAGRRPDGQGSARDKPGRNCVRIPMIVCMYM